MKYLKTSIFVFLVSISNSHCSSLQDDCLDREFDALAYIHSKAVDENSHPYDKNTLKLLNQFVIGTCHNGSFIMTLTDKKDRIYDFSVTANLLTDFFKEALSTYPINRHYIILDRLFNQINTRQLLEAMSEAVKQDSNIDLRCAFKTIISRGISNSSEIYCKISHENYMGYIDHRLYEPLNPLLIGTKEKLQIEINHFLKIKGLRKA